MTVRELRWHLAHPDVDQNAEVRVVYHGYERPSFNLPVARAVATNVEGFQINVEEPREGQNA